MNENEDFIIIDDQNGFVFPNELIEMIIIHDDMSEYGQYDFCSGGQKYHNSFMILKKLNASMYHILNNKTIRLKYMTFFTRREFHNINSVNFYGYKYIRSITYKFDNHYHRLDKFGPALIYFENENDYELYLQKIKMNHLHLPESKIGFVQYNYFFRGLIHRHPKLGPCFVRHNNDFTFDTIEFRWKGILHNPYGIPSKIERTPTIKIVIYSNGGKSHNMNGPARIKYKIKDGKFIKEVEKYYINGENIREIRGPIYDFPCSIKYYDNGQIESEKFKYQKKN